MKYRIYLIAILLTSFVPTMLYSEFIFLSDGTFIKGKIINNGKNKIVIKDDDNEIWNIDQKQISVILKSDKMRVKSDYVKIDNSYLPNTLLLEVETCIFKPLGTLSQISNNGYGLSSKIKWNNLFLKNFNLGFDSGVLYSQGKDLIDSRSQQYDRFLLFPMYLSISYDFGLSDSFFISPEFSAGIVYYDIKLYDYTTGASGDSERSETFISPAIKAGFTGNYKISDSIIASIGCEYGIIVEKNDLLCFAIFSFGAGLIF